jgi:hypothetical protein
VPFIGLLYGGQFFQDLHLSKDYIQFDLTLQHILPLEPRQAKFLKKIESKWVREINKHGDSSFTQIHLDENFFNTFFSAFTTMNQMFSVREMFNDKK